MPIFNKKRQRRVPLKSRPDLVEALNAIVEEDGNGNWHLKALELQSKSGHSRQQKVTIIIEEVLQINGNDSLILQLPPAETEDDALNIHW